MVLKFGHRFSASPRNPQKKGIPEQGNFWEACCFIFLKNSRTSICGKTLREPLPLIFVFKGKRWKGLSHLASKLSLTSDTSNASVSAELCWCLSKDLTAWSVLSLLEQIILRKFFGTRTLSCLLGSSAHKAPRTKG